MRDITLCQNAESTLIGSGTSTIIREFHLVLTTPNKKVRVELSILLRKVNWQPKFQKLWTQNTVGIKDWLWNLGH